MIKRHIPGMSLPVLTPLRLHSGSFLEVANVPFSFDSHIKTLVVAQTHCPQGEIEKARTDQDEVRQCACKKNTSQG